MMENSGCGAFRGGQSQVPDGYCAGEKPVWFEHKHKHIY